jgi:hypothetical protein
MTRAGIHCIGPYEVENAKVRSRGVYTNNPISGAMRRFGLPQIAFACESQMDLLAQELHLDPYEVRRKNLLSRGSKTITGQCLEHSVGIEATLRGRVKISKPALHPLDTLLPVPSFDVHEIEKSIGEVHLTLVIDGIAGPSDIDVFRLGRLPGMKLFYIGFFYFFEPAFITKLASCLIRATTRWARNFQFFSALHAKFGPFSVIKLAIWTFHITDQPPLNLPQKPPYSMGYPLSC